MDKYMTVEQSCDPPSGIALIQGRVISQESDPRLTDEIAKRLVKEGKLELVGGKKATKPKSDTPEE